MVLLSKSLLQPSAIQNFNPDQLAIVVNYTVNNGTRQTWIMCDEFPYRIFVIPEKLGFSLEHILDTLDQHFESVVFFPSQQQFIKSTALKSSMNSISETDAVKFSINLDIDMAKIGKALAMKVITLLKKLIQIGYEIIKLAAKDIFLLAGFAGKHLLKLFLNIMILLVDCYEAIPIEEEAIQKREAADNLREDIEILDNIKIMDKVSSDTMNTLKKIVAIIKGEVDDAKTYEDDFMKELNRDIPLAPSTGNRVRM
jgi:hypothetical protein